VRNFFRNLNIVQNTVLYRAMDMPVVITGSGPSLESAVDKIRVCREGVFIIAASSSLPALAAGGITPDMVISTDGGGWALLHLYACFRSPVETSPPMLACALSAAIPSQCSAVPLLPISDGSLWQSMALNAAGIPSALIPQRGTVTATALELAMTLSGGSIFLAGMDLAVSGIKSHARPYGFDHLFFGCSSRFLPAYSQYFMRSNAIAAGGSHDVYAAWFKSRLSSWPQRIFSLGGNHAAFESKLPSKPLAASHGHGADNFRIMCVPGFPKDRCRKAAETLRSALEDPRYSQELTGELAPLLFPSRTGVTAGEIAEALNDMARRYWEGPGG
jgi:hypothetical protein